MLAFSNIAGWPLLLVQADPPALGRVNGGHPNKKTTLHGRRSKNADRTIPTAVEWKSRIHQSTFPPPMESDSRPSPSTRRLEGPASAGQDLTPVPPYVEFAGISFFLLSRLPLCLGQKPRVSLPNLCSDRLHHLLP